MAHITHKKAQACALLLLGNSVRYVAKETGVPRSTIHRWKQELVEPLLKDIAQEYGIGAELSQYFRR